VEPVDVLPEEPVVDAPGELPEEPSVDPLELELTEVLPVSAPAVVLPLWFSVVVEATVFVLLLTVCPPTGGPPEVIVAPVPEPQPDVGPALRIATTLAVTESAVPGNRLTEVILCSF
jgi:hypothetical protein